MQVNKILDLLYAKQKALESNFERTLVEKEGFEYGQSYQNGINISVLFKTFLKEGQTTERWA